MSTLCDYAILRISPIVKIAVEASRLKKELLNNNRWDEQKLSAIQAAIAKTRSNYPNAGSELFVQQVNHRLGYKLSESAIFNVARYDEMLKRKLFLRQDFFKCHNWTLPQFETVYRAAMKIQRSYPAAGSELFCQEVRELVKSF